MRKIADIAARDLGQPVVVENKPGASGVVGMAEMAKVAPDGYTLALATGATVFIAPNLRQVPFDPQKDLTPIMNYSGSFHGVVGAGRFALEVAGRPAGRARRRSREC